MARTAMQRQASLREKAFGDTHVTADRPSFSPRRAAGGVRKGAKRVRRLHKRFTRPVKTFRWHI